MAYAVIVNAPGSMPDEEALSAALSGVHEIGSCEKVYRERANGQWEYWTHSDGERVKISKSIFDKMVRQGAKIVDA